MSERNRLIPAVQVAVLAAATAVAAMTSHAADWHPVPLLVTLFALAVASDVMIVEMRGVRVSGAFFSVVLAMVLLGPAPAVAVGLGTTLVYAVISRRAMLKVLNDAATWAAFPLVGGLLATGLITDPAQDGLAFGAVVVLVYMTTNIMNFTLVALYYRVTDGIRLWASVKSVYLTVLASEFATALLTAASRTATSGSASAP